MNKLAGPFGLLTAYPRMMFQRSGGAAGLPSALALSSPTEALITYGILPMAMGTGVTDVAKSLLDYRYAGGVLGRLGEFRDRLGSGYKRYLAARGAPGSTVKNPYLINKTSAAAPAADTNKKVSTEMKKADLSKYYKFASYDAEKHFYTMCREHLGEDGAIKVAFVMMAPNGKDLWEKYFIDKTAAICDGFRQFPGMVMDYLQDDTLFKAAAASVPFSHIEEIITAVGMPDLDRNLIRTLLSIFKMRAPSMYENSMSRKKYFVVAYSIMKNWLRDGGMKKYEEAATEPIEKESAAKSIEKKMEDDMKSRLLPQVAKRANPKPAAPAAGATTPKQQVEKKAYFQPATIGSKLQTMAALGGLAGLTALGANLYGGFSHNRAVNKASSDVMEISPELLEKYDPQDINIAVRSIMNAAPAMAEQPFVMKHMVAQMLEAPTGGLSPDYLSTLYKIESEKSAIGKNRTSFAKNLSDIALGAGKLLI